MKIICELCGVRKATGLSAFDVVQTHPWDEEVPEWKFTCTECDAESFSPYDIAFYQLRTDRELAEWIQHLSSKIWFKRGAVNSFLSRARRLVSESAAA